MPPTTPTLRPLSCWKTILRRNRQFKAQRSLTTYHKSVPFMKFEIPPPGTPPRKIKVYPAPRGIQVKEPIKALHTDQISVLDPTGARTNLFAKDNKEGAKVGDVLLVRLKSGDPFAGVCINIRRRGVDTGILLRNQLTRVGVEMWFKIYSPNVEGVEVVQKKERRARRARLTYMRKPKHDMGSVQNIVAVYQRNRGAMGAGSTDKKKNARNKLKKRV